MFIHNHQLRHHRSVIGLRKRRLLAQAAIVLGILFGGVYYLGWPETHGLTLRQWEKSPVRGDQSDSEPIIPGIIVGSGGTFHGAPDIGTDEPESEPEPEVQVEIEQPSDPDPLGKWGLDLRADRFLGGITPWPPNPPIDQDSPALSSLGHFADNVYKIGHTDFESYRSAMLEFAQIAFPNKIKDQLIDGLDKYLGTEPGWQGGQGKKIQTEDWDKNKRVWQTDKDTKQTDTKEVATWRDGEAKREGWEWELMTDKKADSWVDKILRHERIEQMWHAFPTGILRSDALRYLLLLLEGGIYSDTDTRLLKRPSTWGHGATLWRNGDGWLDEQSRNRIIDGAEDVDAVLGRPSVVVGIEADVGGREDWFDWWPRPIQIVQWTMASAPYHPIALNALLRVLHETGHAVEWAHDHATKIRHLNSLGRYDDAKALAKVKLLDDEKVGGAGGVMAWTGPGVWTDAVLSYLRIKYGMNWTDLKNIRQPIRVGEVVILPVTGFSPGVGNFGSQPPWHRDAMVEHLFRGSWKDN
ncbi:hypothetical protein BCR39DRAFT_563283 [Naematelia encephala]|uniref:Nucleotide-diphospho-sugar transferase n=1 Tax=Naematelia encephala TaxID=71784 RepID=A0A1Y2BM77_9TREE|nr:hypothetical protein BCR39DRAFT_563283 [Naematelia encephala]